jgi:membrane protease subunit HflK
MIMPWNEPGKDKDPWGQRNNDAPPDLDEVFKNLKRKLAGIIGGKGGPRKGGGSSDDYTNIILLAIAALVVVWLLSGIYIVDEGKRGVETRFGARTIVTMPGPHWHLPWPIEDYELVDVEAVRTANHSSQMLTSDENIVNLSLAVQYNVKNPQNYAFEVRDPDITLKQAAETAIREVVGRNKMDFVITDGRAVVASETKRIMQEILDSYKTGLNVLQLNLDKAQPPEQVRDAFEDAIKAREDQQRIINEANAYRNDLVPKARGDAKRMLEEAEAYRTQVLKSSQGESERFSKLLTEYKRAPEVTRERLYIETLEQIMSNNPKVVLDVQNGNNLTYLPLDRIISKDKSSGSKSLGISNSSGTESGSSLGSALDEFRRNAARSRMRETR